MQILIDIDNNLYTRLFDNGQTDAVDMLKACVAIRKGMPLPKGHGRIADMDAAIKCIEDVEGEDAIWAISLIEWACSKRTIIPASYDIKDSETYYRTDPKELSEAEETLGIIFDIINDDDGTYQYKIRRIHGVLAEYYGKRLRSDSRYLYH